MTPDHHSPDVAAGTLIMELHQHGDADESPMQMISDARLAYYKRIEAAAKVLAAALDEASDA